MTQREWSDPAIAELIRRGDRAREDGRRVVEDVRSAVARTEALVRESRRLRGDWLQSESGQAEVDG